MRFSQAQALTRCKGFFPMALSWDRRSVLPSMAITPLTVPVKPLTQSKKHCSNSCGLIRQKTRRNVSCDGIPFGSSKRLSSHSRLSFPNCSISGQLSAPQMTAQTAMIMISINLCSFVRSIRGSCIFAKLSPNEKACFVSIPDSLG